MKPIRIWYQSYVDYDNGKTYWDRLRKHLDEIAEPGTTIDIKEDGTITIASVNGDAANAAKARIEAITADVEVGKIYEGTVLKLLDFGAIVSILPGRDGLLHISQIANERVNAVADYLKEGQKVRVKVLEADEKGRVRLSMKAVTVEEGGVAAAPAVPQA